MVAHSDSSAAGAVTAQRFEAARRPWLIAALYVTLSALALYPLFTATVPPLVDYPNHLARMHILAAWQDIPALQRNYQLRWPLQPNLAMDVLLSPLARLLAVYDAGRLFIALTLLTLIGGVLTLHKVLHGRIGLWPALLFLPLYNTVLFWGFMNFLFGAGLALFALSAWIALRRRDAWLRLALFSLVAVLLFFTHLVAFGVYGLCLLGYELWRIRKEGLTWDWPSLRDGIAAGGQFALPFVLLLHWYASDGSTQTGGTHYGTWELKLYALLAPVSFGAPSFDFACSLVVLLALVWAWRSRSVTFAPELIGPVILLAIAALLMPNRLSGVWGTDFRIPAILMLVVVAGIRVGRPAIRFGAVIVAIATVLFAYRVASVAETWRTVDRRYEEFRQATSVMEAGSSLLLVLDQEDFKTAPAGTDYRHYMHMASLAVIERGVFLPNLFTGHTTAVASPERAAIDSPVGRLLSREQLIRDADPETARHPLGHNFGARLKAYWTNWPENFDYVLVIRFRNAENPYPVRLRPVHVGSYFDIYRVGPGETD